MSQLMQLMRHTSFYESTQWKYAPTDGDYERKGLIYESVGYTYAPNEL
ncbi:hypothetical protein NLX69_01875 [Rossellomorea sp. BNER]|nr:hypothetical protein [Rossellomorea sp. BNER]